MKIKLKSKLAGPQGLFAAGSVVEWPDDEARSLIARGYATEAETEPEAPGDAGTD